MPRLSEHVHASGNTYGTSAPVDTSPHARPLRRAYARVSASDGFSAMCSSRDARADPAASQAPRYASASLTASLPVSLRPVPHRTRQAMPAGNVCSGHVTNTRRSTQAHPPCLALQPAQPDLRAYPRACREAPRGTATGSTAHVFGSCGSTRCAATAAAPSGTRTGSVTCASSPIADGRGTTCHRALPSSSFRHGSRFGRGTIPGKVLQSMTRAVTASRDDCNIVGKKEVRMTRLPGMIRCVSKYVLRALARLCHFRRHDIGKAGFSDVRKYSHTHTHAVLHRMFSMRLPQASRSTDRACSSDGTENIRLCTN